jgi:phage terminase large subunit
MDLNASYYEIEITVAKKKTIADVVRDGNLTIPYKYKPRDYQRDHLFIPMEQNIRRIGAVWHRRAGKDKSCWNLMIREAFKRVGNYYYVFPQQNQARKDLWEARGKDGVKFLDHIPPTLIDGKPHETEMKVRLTNGSLIQFIGADNIHPLRGSNPLGLVYSEFSYCDPLVWDIFRPVINENGGWAVFNFTPNSQNHAYDLYMNTNTSPNWHWSVLTVNDTHRPDGSPIVTEDMINEDRKSGMDEDLINQEYYCSFTGVMFGSYYGRILEASKAEGRIGEFAYNPQKPVETAWDIGIKDSTAIWFYQKNGGYFDFIDYYEDNGEALDHYIQYLYKKRYTYSVHLGPHDIKSRNFATGKSTSEMANQLTGKRDFFKMVPKSDIQEGIDVVRMTLPRCRFDAVKCKRGLEALRQYHKRWNQDRRTFSLKPEHDWSSNGADAFRTFANGVEEEKTKTKNVFWSPPRELGSLTWMGS